MARILVADDDRDARELCVFSLRFAGHEVLGVESGEEAIQRAQLTFPDVILIDFQTPKINGIKACTILKADRGTGEIPVIFLLERGEEAEVDTAFRVGAADYILKPIAPDQLVKKIKHHLDQAKKLVQKRV